MFGKMLVPASRLARAAVLGRSVAAKNIAVVTRSGSSVAHHDMPTPREMEHANKNTYDFQHTPTGPWAQGMSNQQAYYNKWLLVGISLFLATLITGRILREDMYWNAPELPRKNPPPFSMKQMEKDALAALEGGDDDDDE